MRSIRASSLPLALACPASQVLPAVALASDSPESRLGSAVHEVLAAVVRDNIDGAAFSDANIAAAARWRVELTDVYELAWNGRRAWDRLKGYFLLPQVEAELAALSGDKEFMLTGHVDVGFIDDDCVTILDWKSGFADEDHEQQMRAYAWLALQDVFAGGAVAFLVRLREMTVDKYEWSRAELDAWFEGVVRDTADVGRFNAGRHCNFCGRRDECAARVNRESSNSEVILRSNGYVPETPGATLALYDRAKMVRDAADAALDVVRCQIDRHGPITGPDGRTLALVRQERREIDASKAWDILDTHFGRMALAAMKVSKSKVEELARSQAPRGDKTAAAKALLKELDTHGALITTTVEKLECRRGSSNSIETNNTAVSRPAIAAGDGDRDPAA